MFEHGINIRCTKMCFNLYPFRRGKTFDAWKQDEAFLLDRLYKKEEIKLKKDTIINLLHILLYTNVHKSGNQERGGHFFF